ncbi:hypothetical protein Tco_0391090 [Tanacetum coccineum]
MASRIRMSSIRIIVEWIICWTIRIICRPRMSRLLRGAEITIPNGVGRKIATIGSLYGSGNFHRIRTEVLVCGTGAITDNNGPQELELDWSGNLRGWTVQYFVNKKVHLVFVTSGIGFTTEEVGIGVLDINSRSGS